MDLTSTYVARLPELQADLSGVEVGLRPISGTDCYYSDGMAVGASWCLFFEQGGKEVGSLYLFPAGYSLVLEGSPYAAAVRAWIAKLRETQ